MEAEREGEPSGLPPALPDGDLVWAALTELSGDGIIITGADLDAPGPTILFVNDAVTRVTGYGRDELLGASPRIFQGPNTDRAELRRIGDHLRRGQPVRSELVNHRKDGVETVIELEITPIHDGDRVVAFIAIQRDVTVSHMRERWFRSLVEHSAEMITVSDPRGVVSYVSPSVEPMLGWRPDEIVGQQSNRFVHPDDAARIATGLRTKSDRPGTNPPVEFRFRAADGSWRWIEAVTTNLLDEPVVRGMVVNARDITVRKRLEEELHQAQKMEAVGRLAGGVAHDFNNLLTVISGHAALLDERLPDDDELRSHLRAVLEAGTRATELTRQLLTISRRHVVTPRAIDVNAVVTDTLGLLQRVIGEHITVVTALDTDPAVIVADPDLLGQVLMNLALNARDAMPDGGEIRVSTDHLDLDATEADRLGRLVPGPYVVLTFADTGTGMDDETRARIFEPFFTTKQDGGTGLGLAIAYEIVRQSGGAIAVDSDLGRGTTFTVHLPSAGPPGAPMPSSRTDGTRTNGTEDVLVVEDDTAVAALVEQMLTALGYRVTVCHDPLLAMDALRPEHALVVCDVLMPGLTGPELTGKFRAHRPDLRVLYISGYADVTAGERMLDAPLLPKPFTLEQLGAAARAVLDG